ncbi:hypothetical protein FRB90_006667 [Tulasnella sp. 427]|nr:hypothetical protein FRB90_006667 [Tulasnella sp. 427]
MALGSPSPSTTAGSSPTDTSNSTNTGGTNGLYLYTFLITLLVLLSVASLIIIRSCVLRRRFRRQMRAAIEGGGGFVLPPSFAEGVTAGGIPVVLQGRRRKEKVVLGPKPVMWEVWMEKGKGEGEGDELGLPISTTLVRPALPDPLSPSATTPSSPPTGTSPPFVLTRETAQEYFGIDVRSFREVVHDNWRHARGNLQRTLSPTAVNPSTTPNGAGVNTPKEAVVVEEEEGEERRLAVGYLIAMPDAQRPSYAVVSQVEEDRQEKEELGFYSPEELHRGKMKALQDTPSTPAFTNEDGELPSLVFGVVDVEWTGRNVPQGIPRTGSGS